jgi:hypothetical protein
MGRKLSGPEGHLVRRREAGRGRSYRIGFLIETRQIPDAPAALAAAAERLGHFLIPFEDAASLGAAAVCAGD